MEWTGQVYADTQEAKIVFVRLRKLEAAMKHNLAAIKELAERAQ